jgi:hypothetical protein
MPYIRLYSRSLPLQRKRSIAHQLISITERTFQLSPEECANINVQFLPPPLSGEGPSLDPSSQTADVFVEVSDRYLTAEKITAFVEASAPILSSAVLTSESRRFARALGLEADPALQVAFQFNVSGAAYRNASGASTAAVPERKAA